MPVAVADGTGGCGCSGANGSAAAGRCGTTGTTARTGSWHRDGPCRRTAGSRRRVDDDLFALFHPTSANQRLWLFWARHEPGGPPGQTRWSVAWRVKQGLDPTAQDWSTVQAAAEGRDRCVHDRQPAPLLTADGNLELFGQLDAERRLDDQSRRTPSRPGRSPGAPRCRWWVHRTRAAGPAGRRHRQRRYAGHAAGVPVQPEPDVPSDTFGATQILDDRYAGTTTVDTTGTAKLALHGRSRTSRRTPTTPGGGAHAPTTDRIARDTIGLYLTPGTTDLDEVKAMSPAWRTGCPASCR